METVDVFLELIQDKDLKKENVLLTHFLHSTEDMETKGGKTCDNTLLLSDIREMHEVQLHLMKTPSLPLQTLPAV